MTDAIPQCRDCSNVRPVKARGLCGTCYHKRLSAGRRWDGPPPLPLTPLAGQTRHWRQITGDITRCYTFTVYPGQPRRGCSTCGAIPDRLWNGMCHS